MRAAWWEEGRLRFIDQRRLPHRLEMGEARDAEEAARAIEDMAVRGAPLIGVVAAYGLALAARRGDSVPAAYARLSRSRPTAINLWAGLDAVRDAMPDAPAPLEHVEDQNLVGSLNDLKGARFVQDLPREARGIADGRERIVDVVLVDGARAVARLEGVCLLLCPVRPRRALVSRPRDAGAAGIPDAADVALRRGRGVGLRRAAVR